MFPAMWRFSHMGHREVAFQLLKGGALLQQSRVIIVLYATGMWRMAMGS